MFQAFEMSEAKHLSLSRRQPIKLYPQQFAQFNGNCAVDPDETPNTDESALLIRNSTGDTALSLDEGRQTGQSVLQQCRRG